MRQYTASYLHKQYSWHKATVILPVYKSKTVNESLACTVGNSGALIYKETLIFQVEKLVPLMKLFSINYKYYSRDILTNILYSRDAVNY